MRNATKLADDFCEHFDCFIDVDENDKLYYVDEKECKKHGYDDDFLVFYDASNIDPEQLKDLMRKSLETGVNLIFEQVKDKKIDSKELDKIREKEWEEGFAILESFYKEYLEPFYNEYYEDHSDEASVPSPRDEDILSDKSSEGCLG